MTPYETLGVARDASPDDIKKAYRREVSKAHPDREGGDTARARAVNDAYAVLSDPERRARFDATGEDAPAQTLQSKAEAALITALMQALDHESLDPLGYVRAKMNEITNRARQQHRLATKRKDGLAKMAQRARSKSGSRLLHDIIDAQIKRQQGAIDEADEATAIAAEGLKMLADFELEPDKQERREVSAHEFVRIDDMMAALMARHGMR